MTQNRFWSEFASGAECSVSELFQSEKKPSGDPRFFLINKKAPKFTIDALVDMLARTGKRVEFAVA